MISLPAAVAAAGVDPEALHAMLAAGEPDSIFALAKVFDNAGMEAGISYDRAKRSHTAIGEAFLNNGRAVLDVDGHNDQSWKLLGQGGDDMDATAHVLKRVGTALEGNTDKARRVVARMDDDVETVRRAWVRFRLDNQGQGTPAQLAEAETTFLAQAVAVVQAAGRDVQALIDDYETVLASSRGELTGRGYRGADPTQRNPLSAAAVAADADLIRTGVNNTEGAADDILDRGTATLQSIAATLRAGGTLNPEQQRYITGLTDAVGADVLGRLPGLAASGDAGSVRALGATGDVLTALTNPALGGLTTDRLPAALRDLTTDPLAGQPPSANPSEQTRASTVRYERMGDVLGASTLPMGTDFGVAAGKQAIINAQQAHSAIGAGANQQPLHPIRTSPAEALHRTQFENFTALRSGSAQMLTNAARDIDTSQALVGDRDIRGTLLTSEWADRSGAAALLDEATARVQPTATQAETSAAITRDLFTDIADDPDGWRDVIAKGSPISDEITSIVAENIDAFGSKEDAETKVLGASATPGGYYTALDLGRIDAENVMTFVGAGRDSGVPYDPDLLAVHTAAHLYAQHLVADTIRTGADPATTLGQVGGVTAAINIAEFRTSIAAFDDVDQARSQLYNVLSAAGGLGAGRLVETASGALPGWIGDGLSMAVDEVTGSFEPQKEAGKEGAALRESLASRQLGTINHLLVDTYQQLGMLPSDARNLDAVTDGTGRLSPLDSFYDKSSDPDVRAGDVRSRDALTEVARSGPVGGEPDRWSDAVKEFTERVGTTGLDPDYANPDPRIPLDPEDVARWRTGSGRGLPESR